jgi:cell division protein FtsQ
VWDNPRLLNTAANFLVGVALALLLVAGAQVLLRSPWLELREVTVLGAPTHVDREQIRRATQAALTGANFLAVDIDAVRGALERLPWVRRVELRRVWPDRLEISLEEHMAFAHWGDAGLVNTHGEFFAARTDESLPFFAGPPGAEAEVTRRYRVFAQMVAPLSDVLERVTLTSRYAWQLRLQSGLQIELGRDYPAEPADRRLARFVAAYPQTLGRIQRHHEYVDLRYSNGFALRIPELDG